MRKPSRSAPPTKPVDADTAALTSTGSARPRKSAARFAGVASTAESVCVQRSPSIAKPIPKSAASDARLHRVADHEQRVRLEVGGAAEVGEEEDLGRRAEQQRRDVDRRADPGEERAVADRPADEEDAEPGSHVSESVARSRASRSKWWRSSAASAVYATLSGDADEQRRADVTADRGAAHGSHAPGRRERPRDRADPAGEQRERDEHSGDRPDRVLERLRERARGAVENERRGEHEPEHADRENGGRDRDREQQRVLDVQRHPEQEPSPEQRRGDRVDADAGDRDRDRGEHEDQRARVRRRAARGSRTSAAAGSRRRRSSRSSTRSPSRPRRARRRGATAPGGSP